MKKFPTPGVKIRFFAIPAILLGIICCFTTGCIGKDTVAFVTSTSIGVDADVKPPTASIGYHRIETVLQPQFEGGQTFPVLSSVATNATIPYFSSGHSFATGAAAVIMSYLLNDSDPTAPLKSPFDLVDPIQDSSLINAKGVRPDTLRIANASDDKNADNYWKKKSKPVFFTTYGSLALEIKWDEVTNVPTGIHLGYKRQEIAIAPLIAKEDKTNKSVDITLVSLLATANAESKVKSGADDRMNSGITVRQFFATGAAATYLSMHRSIREVLGREIIQNYDLAKIVDDGIEKSQKQITLQNSINYKFETAAAPDRFRFYKTALGMGMIDASQTSLTEKDMPNIKKFTGIFEPPADAKDEAAWHDKMKKLNDNMN